MGSSPLMALGVKAMAANYAALQVTGHNIANANVAGYSRQQVELRTATGQSTGSGFFGGGVDAAAVTRSHNEFLTREAASTRSMSAMDSARLEQLRRMENVFKTGEMGLGNAVNEFLSAMTDLSSQPADMALRRVAMTRAGELASRFGQAGAALDTIQEGVTQEMRTAVTEVNGLAKSIAEVNKRIAATQGLGQSPNDLLDERERLISRLSTHVQVSRMEAPDGTMSVFISGGQQLVLGSVAGKLKLMQDESDASRMAVALSEAGVLRQLGSETLGASLGGLLRFQNQDLVSGRTLIGQLAASVGGAINEQQLRGLNLQVPYGQVPSRAIFALGPAQTQGNAGNARNGSGVLVGAVSLTITDPSALQASEYDLRETAAGSGSWVLTRLQDGLRTAVSSGDVVDGMQIDFSAAPPQPGDRFLLQPVTRTANGMAQLLSDPRDLAAAAPLLAGTAPGNLGTVAVASLQVNAALLPVPDATARVTFTSDSGDYTWELFDASNTLLSSGTANWQPGQPVPTPPTDINGFSLQLNGVPRSGDVITVEPTPASAVAANNGNALAMLALRDAGITGGRTATDAWSSALADIGVMVQSGKTSAAISDDVAGQAEFSRSSQSGVNLDEEAARLIQYQQSYQAAAKVLQVAQSLFDTLIQSAGG